MCVYGVIMHAGNVRRIREKRVKHEAWYSPDISYSFYKNVIQQQTIFSNILIQTD